MRRVIILGAGGRDFHNFNVFFRDNPDYRVVAFTAAQIPFIENRLYPPELSGRFYPEGIPIYPEERLFEIIETLNTDLVVFSYSDISHEDIMHRVSSVMASGMDFMFLGPDSTMLKSKKPVISVCAVRTGCGKSAMTRKIATYLKENKLRVSVIRHPMAYCDFEAVQKFERLEDLDTAACTIEEREEFEPLIARGITVFAGIDYEKILFLVEENSDIILWDGGNNDFPFIMPDLEIVLLDALRPGHEVSYFPGKVNLRRADVLVITKVNEAKKEDLNLILSNISRNNKKAKVINASSIINIDMPEMIKGKKALIVEDGPSITHGGIPYGAGASVAKGLVAELVDPRMSAVGSIKQIFEIYPHIGNVLPAMGYSGTQKKELEETINNAPCEVVVIATPIDLTRVINIKKPFVKVGYELEVDVREIIGDFIKFESGRGRSSRPL